MEFRRGAGQKYVWKDRFCGSLSRPFTRVLSRSCATHDWLQMSRHRRSDLAEPCGVVIADVEAASGGWPAVQHFAPRGGPGFLVRSRGRHMVARAARSASDTTARADGRKGPRSCLRRQTTQ